MTTSGNAAAVARIEAETKAECVYNILTALVGATPAYANFTRWFCYPVTHATVACMTASLEQTRELLPLQRHLDREMQAHKVLVTLKVIKIC